MNTVTNAIIYAQQSSSPGNRMVCMGMGMGMGVALTLEGRAGMTYVRGSGPSCWRMVEQIREGQQRS